MSKALLCILLFALPLALGCGGQAHFEADKPPPRTDRIEKMLSGMSETGDRSPLPYLKQEVIALKMEGNPHAIELQAAVAQMENTKDSAQLKAIAAKAHDLVAAGK